MHHLAKAALSQNHDEVEVGEFHPVLVAIAVILAHRWGGRWVCGLPWTHPRPLETVKLISWHRNREAAQIIPAVNLWCLTSNFCRSSSLPSSPSGCTGTLKYSPSSWDSSLNLNPRINTNSVRLSDCGNKYHNYFCLHPELGQEVFCQRQFLAFCPCTPLQWICNKKSNCDISADLWL